MITARTTANFMFDNNTPLGDESYTRPSLVLVLLPYLTSYCKAKGKKPHEITIWCPFDMTAEMRVEVEGHTIQLQVSQYHTILTKEGYNVICTHLFTGEDFFEHEPFDYDIIIGNPPFANKRKFFERALGLDVPFAMLSTATWLNDRAPLQIFSEAGVAMQLLMPLQRAHFDKPKGYGHTAPAPSFKSMYYCSGFLANTHDSKCEVCDLDLYKSEDADR